MAEEEGEEEEGGQISRCIMREEYEGKNWVTITRQFTYKHTLVSPLKKSKIIRKHPFFFLLQTWFPSHPSQYLPHPYCLLYTEHILLLLVWGELFTASPLPLSHTDGPTDRPTILFPLFPPVFDQARYDVHQTSYFPDCKVKTTPLTQGKSHNYV